LQNSGDARLPPQSPYCGIDLVSVAAYWGGASSQIPAQPGAMRPCWASKNVRLALVGSTGALRAELGEVAVNLKALLDVDIMSSLGNDHQPGVAQVSLQALCVLDGHPRVLSPQ